MQTLSLNNYFLNRITHLLSNRLFIRLLFFISIAAWCAGFICNSIFPHSAYAALASLFLKGIYGNVCHQHIEKTFLLNGHYFFVCARCTGIYFGTLAISAISLFSLPKLPVKMKLLYFSAVPMLIDVFSTTMGIYHYSKIIALLTGIFFGSAVFAYILAALENNFMDKSL